jgi:hypothetical protein
LVINRDGSAVFEGSIGKAAAAISMAKGDYLIDPSRFPSEGKWAFCRFEGDEIPALRLGFQRGGFNGGIVQREPSPSYLQLHLEVMTREGAILWLPSGMYHADRVISDPLAMNIRFDHNGRNILRFQGWPTIECRVCSEDEELQADLQFVLEVVSVLPDCILPHCLFGMWESMGSARGTVRYRTRTVAVQGRVFFDHTRVVPRRHASASRHMYVYTTLAFEDGGGLFGYHSVDAQGHLIDGYCFSVYLDAEGNGQLLEDSALSRLRLDPDGIAKSWQVACTAPELSLLANVTARDSPIQRCWGSPGAPQTRKEFSIIPLVLDGSVHISASGQSRTLKARGLAEYFNADLWPADKAALQGAAATG